MHASKHDQQEGYILPKSWQENKEALNKETPFNFVCTADIIGGNSGSPVINKHGQIVGLIFDGNRSSLAWNYAFDQTQGRAISVHSQAIIEALRHIYNAPELAREILGDA